MIITYDKQYSIRCGGKDWTLYTDLSTKDSLIVQSLHSLVVNSQTLSFEEVYDKMRMHYEAKTVRSKCGIYKGEDVIDVTTKGVLPRFYLEKKS